MGLETLDLFEGIRCQLEEVKNPTICTDSKPSTAKSVTISNLDIDAIITNR